MGKLLVSTPLGPSWLVYCGIPTYQGQDTNSNLFSVQNLEIRPEADFKDVMASLNGIIATTDSGALWANGCYRTPFLGVDWNALAVYTQGDILSQVARAGYDRCFGWGEELNGIWVTKTDGTLHYSGNYFWGCGLPDEAPYNLGVDDIHQVGTDTTWSNLTNISGSDSYWRAFFTFSDGRVLAAGDNADGSLGNTYYTDDTIHVTYPIPFISTPQAVELTSDDWHSGSYFRTAANEMYHIGYRGDVGHTVYTLVETNVTRMFGGSDNWFVCYEKTDGSIHRIGVGAIPVGPPIQVHPGPAAHVFVDPRWGIITITRTDGVVDMFEDEGIPLYTDIFPGQIIRKTTSIRGIVIGLTASPVTFTNVPSPIISTTGAVHDLNHTNGYNISAGSIHTPHLSILSTGEIIANQTVV